MTDEALRALERAAAADTSQLLALARALERAGRADEAWVALCRGVERAEVRAELVARPAWTHPDGQGGARFLDVPPVRRAPRARWTVRVAGGRRLLASPPGVVLLEGPDRPTSVLDPRTGRLRWTPDQFTRDAWLDGGLLLAQRRLEELLAWRLWSEEGEQLPNAGHVRLSAAPERIELTPDGDALRLLARPFRAPLADDPDLGLIEPQVLGRAGLAVARVRGGRCVVTDARSGTAALVGQSFEPDEGLEQTWVRDLGEHGVAPPSAKDPRWVRRGRLLAADGQGVVLLEAETLRLLDLDGRERWSDHRAGGIMALGPAHLVLGPAPAPRRRSAQGDSIARIHERSSGRLLASVPCQRARAPGCLVRDLLVLPGADDTLAAWTPDGALVWRVPVGDGLVDVAPLPGALVVLRLDRQVLLLEEPPAVA